jgi:heat shock protein HtpX
MAMKEKQPDPIKTFRAQWAVMTFYERFEQVIALALSAIIAVIIVVSLLRLISIVFSLLVIDAFNPLDHKVFQTVFGMIMTLLIAMEFKHSIVRVALRRDSIIQVKTVILIGLIALARKFVILDPETSPLRSRRSQARRWPSGRLTGCCASAMTGPPGKAQMSHRDRRHAQAAGARHRWLNRLQTALLVLTLLGIAAVAGSLLGARPLHPNEAPDLWAVLRELAARAGLPAVPVPHYVPSGVVNAFATGTKHHAAIALTDGLLRSLTPRELTGVLGHEIAHIANEDLRVMGLADSISRLTHLLALLGQIMLLFSLPALLWGTVAIQWPALLLLAFRRSSLLALGLSRVREFDADRLAAELTGDPQGLALALAKIERESRAWLLPGWGNPEPSWLRTHPATTERIQRLRELADSMAPQPHSSPFLPDIPLAPRPPVGAPAVSGADFNKENGMTYPDLNSRPAPDRFIRRWLVITGCIAALMLLWQFLPAIEAWFSPREAAERTVTPRGDLAADEQTTIQLFEKSRGSVVYITTAQLVRDVWSRNVFPCRAAPAPASSGTMPATW